MQGALPAVTTALLLPEQMLRDPKLFFQKKNPSKHADVNMRQNINQTSMYIESCNRKTNIGILRYEVHLTSYILFS